VRGKHGKRGTLEAISTLVTRTYPSRVPEELSTLRALAWWSLTVSPRILKNARPVRLSRGVLTIHTATSAWANLLQYDSETYLAAIKKHAPEAKIKTIRFRVGPLPEMPVRSRKEKPTTPSRPLTELPEFVAIALAKIANDDVRDAVARAATAGLANKQENNHRKKT
jgi:hypothetical protein